MLTSEWSGSASTHGLTSAPEEKTNTSPSTESIPWETKTPLPISTEETTNTHSPTSEPSETTSPETEINLTITSDFSSTFPTTKSKSIKPTEVSSSHSTEVLTMTVSSSTAGHTAGTAGPPGSSDLLGTHTSSTPSPSLWTSARTVKDLTGSQHSSGTETSPETPAHRTSALTGVPASATTSDTRFTSSAEVSSSQALQESSTGALTTVVSSAPEGLTAGTAGAGSSDLLGTHTSSVPSPSLWTRMDNKDCPPHHYVLWGQRLNEDPHNQHVGFGIDLSIDRCASFCHHLRHQVHKFYRGLFISGTAGIRKHWPHVCKVHHWETIPNKL
ncbi:PREDICTED: mucin-16-like [Elephantulus edwardii]|uniref:mucin-16-like n=1 Tax=Elephantulus edwardii TaxID=28737 RepID=UPI0003F0DD80|nr:PREDICTED: mucin-16-like [Elephantulus edwardii]